LRHHRRGGVGDGVIVGRNTRTVVCENFEVTPGDGGLKNENRKLN